MQNPFSFDVAYFMYILMFIIVASAYKDGFLKNVFGNFFNEIRERKKALIIILIIIVLTVVFLDKRVTLFLNLRENESGLLIFLSHLGNIIGDGKYLFSILTTGALVSLLLKNTKIKNLFYLSLCSSLILSALNFVFKAICHRQRPHTEYNPYLFFAFKKAFVEGKLFTNTYGSLPSGHTISLTGACIIFALYFKNIYFKAFFLILPFLTGVARICTRKHWLSDILISYVIGALFAVSIYKYNSSKFK